MPYASAEVGTIEAVICGSPGGVVASHRTGKPHIEEPATLQRDGAIARRWLVEADFAPVPFTELKLSFRNHDEEQVGKYQEYLAEFYFPF